MVTDRDRAQLILIGAVLIALVVLGLTTIINTVLFTGEVTTTSSTTTGSTAATQFDYEARSAFRSIALRANHDQRNITKSDLNTSIRANTERYRLLRQELSMTSTDTIVNVSFNNNSAGTTYGRRIVQAQDSTFENASGPTWQPVPNGRTVGWLLFNVDVGDTTANSSDSFEMDIVSAASGRSINVSIWEGDGNLSVKTNPSWTGPGNSTYAECAPVRNRVVLDFTTGSSSTGCTSGFDSIAELEQPLQIQFDNGDRLNGQYGIVVNETTVPSPVGSCMSTGPTEPCEAATLWQANTSVSFIAQEIQYTQQHNVTIYNTNN